MKKNANKFVRTGTYVSYSALRSLSRKKNLQLIIGGCFSVSSLLSVAIVFSGNSEIIREELVQDIIILLIFLLIFLLGIKNNKKLGTVRRYNSIFMCDADGTVTIDEISKQTGKPPHQILSELDKLFQEGVFYNCTLQKTGVPCVILLGEENNRTSFVDVVCDKCNGTTRLRLGSYGRCEYCGSAISSRKAVIKSMQEENTK